jgi:hypothetical protein
MKFWIYIVPIFIAFTVASQHSTDAQNIVDCYGSRVIENPGNYVMQFTGRTCDEVDLSIIKIHMAGTSES